MCDRVIDILRDLLVALRDGNMAALHGLTAEARGAIEEWDAMGSVEQMRRA